MPDWYSEFLLSRARQLEIACMAEGNRRLAESGRARRDRRRSRGGLGGLRGRMASALLVLGRSFRSPGEPSISGR